LTSYSTQKPILDQGALSRHHLSSDAERKSNDVSQCTCDSAVMPLLLLLLLLLQIMSALLTSKRSFLIPASLSVQ